MTETIVRKANKPPKEKKEETATQEPIKATFEQLLELQKYFNENYCTNKNGKIKNNLKLV